MVDAPSEWEILREVPRITTNVPKVTAYAVGPGTSKLRKKLGHLWEMSFACLRSVLGALVPSSYHFRTLVGVAGYYIEDTA